MTEEDLNALYVLCLKPLDVKTGQNNLCTGPEATLCPKEPFAKKKADIMTRLRTMGLNI